MLKINQNDFKLDEIDEDIEDCNTLYLYFDNHKGTRFIEVREGNIDSYNNKEEIKPTLKYLLEKSDFSKRTRETITYCYDFWMTSCNGLNCFIEQDIYEDDGFKKPDFENMFNELSKYSKGDEIVFEEETINIYPVFAQLFNMYEIYPEFLPKKEKNQTEDFVAE